MKIPRLHPSFASCAILSFGLLLMVGCKDRGTAPDFHRATAKVAGNTANNVRQRDDTTPTSGYQKNSPADSEITQKIRKALMIDACPATAKNIKITTVDSKVTLCGPVKTEAEKMGIMRMAQNVAGKGNVGDQLKVKAVR